MFSFSCHCTPNFPTGINNVDFLFDFSIVWAWHSQCCPIFWGPIYRGNLCVMETRCNMNWFAVQATWYSSREPWSVIGSNITFVLSVILMVDVTKSTNWHKYFHQTCFAQAQPHFLTAPHLSWHHLMEGLLVSPVPQRNWTAGKHSSLCPKMTRKYKYRSRKFSIFNLRCNTPL